MLIFDNDRIAAPDLIAIAIATMGNRPSNPTVKQELSELQRKAKTEAALLAGGTGSPTSSSQPAQRNFTLQELSTFNGEDPDKPVYVSLLSDVYDVTADFQDYKPSGGELHVLAGRDASRAVALMSLVEDEAKSTELSDLSDTQLANLNEWVRKFSEEKKYPKVGRLVLLRDFQRDQLRPFNGVDNLRHTVLVGLNRNVYDVTLLGWEHYGPGGGYAQFAGRDASRALACMSFLDEYLDNPTLDELTEEQRAALVNWASRFDQKYPVVGSIVD